ncbi:hypothetical protein CK203_063042 [Vitis vinifera]|uniref:DUF659 domain-containing protein n=1 Tax=Vitis vinifera TaxID=29760 RepID=A0A438G5L0_VITVI|nr:hypothetical protein CK203_063042 [Vitis vinifera]
MNMGSENVNEDLFGLEDEDFGEEINSRMNVTNISSGGSNRERSSGEKMFELLDKWIEQVGEENVVITDNHSSYVMAGLLNMMRRFTRQKELLRPAKTSFATAFITLSQLYEQKKKLEEDVYKFRLVSSPLVCLLCLVDGEKKKAPMGYIYEAMNRVKNTIVRSFNGNEEKYKEIFKIIDERWEIQLPQPLHAIHSKRSNRLDHQHLNDLVYIKYSRALKRRYNEHDTIDPISFKDIDDSNEWLIGRMEYGDSHGGAQNDFVFDDDNLIWGDVGRATGVEEARFDARAQASSSIIPPPRR